MVVVWLGCFGVSGAHNSQYHHVSKFKTNLTVSSLDCDCNLSCGEQRCQTHLNLGDESAAEIHLNVTRCTLK